jgi:hypothetical protein
MFTKIRSAARRFYRQARVRATLHPSIRRYMDFCRRTWPLGYPRRSDSVVLVGIFHWNASVHCYAHITNHLARKTGSVIEWFYLHGRRNYLYEQIFASFGARRGLSTDKLGIDEDAAQQLSAEIFEGLRTKWDVVNLAIAGVEMGDLVYDTYLRTRFRTTVDLHDPALREIILQTIRLTWAAKNYLERKKVVAVIVDHTVYIHCGIMARLACCADIPVFQAYYGPDFYVIRVENDREISDVPTRLPCAQYRTMFGRLTPAQQVSARQRGREGLEERLSGKVDGVLFTRTAYESHDTKAIFPPTTKPRMLVLLNDFCDTVHCYRRMLFPDFYEWIHFVLRIAEQTQFEWYVKPHPSILVFDELGRPEQKEANRLVIAELQEKYPSIHFLDPRVSNRQIIAEGVSAMFTVHGTAGHEFAYLGVPVVNAGDNPHVSYGFNIHPKTVEEYEHCIRSANALNLEIRHDEIEEFFYMNYFYFCEHQRAEGNPIPANYFKSTHYEQGYQGNQPEAFDYFAEPLPPPEAERLERYFDEVLAVAENAVPVAAVGSK